MKFRKKTVEIDAVQLTGDMVASHLFDKGKLPDGVRLRSASSVSETRKVNNFTGAIDTLEGVMDVKIGDWIIKGVKGEFYPCKPDIFAEKYEKWNKSNEMKGREMWIDYLHETNNDSNAKSQRPNGAARKD